MGVKSPDVKIQSEFSRQITRSQNSVKIVKTNFEILFLENVNDITLLAISPRSIVQALCFLATLAKSSEKTI